MSSKLKFKCPECGSNKIYCDIEVEIRYEVIMEDDGTITLETSQGQEYEWGLDDEEATWYCGGCYNKIFVGTKDMFEEYLINGE